MKKLGLIGGTGPESTILYYRAITSGVQKRLQKDFFPHMTIESLSVFEVLDYCDREDYDGLTEYLLRGFRSLKNAGCDFASLTGITPHIVLDKVREKSPIEIISIVDCARDEAVRRSFHRVALLGTYPTMSGTFFQKPFLESGIAVVTPEEADKQYIEHIIETELEYGVVKDDTRARVIQIAEKLVAEQSLDGIVVGCTELPLLFKGAETTVPTIDVMDTHLKRLVDRITESNISPKSQVRPADGTKENNSVSAWLTELAG